MNMLGGVWTFPYAEIFLKKLRMETTFEKKS